MRKDRFWLLIIILVGFGLRLTLLEKQSLWYDEGVTWLLSQMRGLADLIRWTAADIQPPLYYLLIWGNDILFGHSEWALRFPSAMFNTLTIPLIYLLAYRLFSSSSCRRAVVALLAATFFTLSPLMVYYSQEARMYTLLVFEATVTSYLLLKILQADKTHSHSLLFTSYSLTYALFAAAALYTHYFAAFLLIAHATYAVLILWQRGWPKRLVSQLLLIFGLAALLFAPWLPTLLSRLGDDPSYWPGALKLNEAVRKLLISFVVGETVFEQTGLWLALGYLLILIICGVWAIAGWRIGKSANQRMTKNSSKHPKQIRSQQFTTPALTLGSGASVHHSSFIIHHSLLILWLLLPPLLILLLSYRSPKFNPRYTLLSWPAFALFLAAALASLFETQHVTRNASSFTTRRRKSLIRRFPLSTRPVLFTLSLLFILTTSAFSLYNWFTDIRFSKDDFKALAKFVQERISADETVLLSSGHLFPVWAYYYGWDNWTPLPWMQRLDVSRVTDLSIATDIAAAVADKEGVWLVTWQDEVIDPNGVVPFWLDLIGERPLDAGDFYGVGLEHWRLNPRKIELLERNPIRRPIAFNFANQVDLVGLTQLSDTSLALFWRPRQSLPDDLILTLDLTDRDGLDWDRATAVGPPGSFYYPPAHWPVGQIVMTRHQLAWQTGTPPGLYLAEIGLGQVDQANGNSPVANAASTFIGWDILDQQGRPQRRTALLESVNLSQLVRPDTGPLPLDDDPLVDFFPIVAVRRSILPQKSAEPGDRISLALLWQAGEYNLDDLSIAFDLVDSAGQTFRVGSSLTPSRRFNLPRWQPGDLVLGQYWLDIPAAAGAGPATLQLHLVNLGAFAYDEIFPIEELEILPTERNFTPPAAVDIPLEADFSGQTTLIGVDCPTECTAKAGKSITLTLYWRAETSLDKNLTVFTHLLGPDETVLVNADHAPSKPTQGWVSGEIIIDPVTLALPANLPAGEYIIEVGLYDAADPAFTRLPLTTGATRVMLSVPLTVE